MQGLSLDGALLPSLATARVPVATLASPADYGFGSHNVWDVPGELLEETIGSLGALSKDPDPNLSQASRTMRQADDLRRQLGRFIGKDGQVAHQPEGEVPGDGLRPPALLARCAPRRELPDPDGRAHRPGLVRHARRPAGAAAGRCQADRRGPRRLPVGPRAPRHRRPRAHARLERVRPPRAAERLERHRPRRRGRRLPDGHAGAPAHGRRVPGPDARGSTATATSARRPTSAPSTRRSWSSGSTSTRPRSSPTRTRCRA